MPLSTRRLRTRGFNQALELARPLASQLRLPLHRGLLQRVRATDPQSGLTRTDRRRNVRGAFRADPRLRGQRLIVVDDVMTTGATLDALARCLKKQGAVEVGALVVARTPSPR